VLAWSSGKGSFEADDRTKRTLASAVVLPRIYIQIGNEGARAAAQGVQARLEASGYVVPGIERVAAVPTANELRYFEASQEARARDIAQRMAASGIAVEPKFVTGVDQSNVPEQQYELWFAHDEPEYFFPVIASVPDYPQALTLARVSQERAGSGIDVDVYAATDAGGKPTYAVTFGGYMPEAEAKARASAPPAPAGAWVSQARNWGGDLLPTPAGAEVMSVISDLFGIPRSRIRMSSKLGEHLGITPDERTALLRALEKDMGVQIDDRAVANVQTVRQLAGILDSQLSQPN
jgi:hypothetical protein